MKGEYGIMSILVSQFREKMSKEKDPRMSKEKEFDVGYPTGFLAFDFANGVQVNVVPSEKNMNSVNPYTYNSIGIVDGSMVTCVGRSGCGKTTFAIQAAGQIVKPFENSAIFHEDLEGGATEMRKRQLLDMQDEEVFNSKYICRNTGITTENFFARIKAVHDMKLENRKEFEYDTGLHDIGGNRIYKLQPTVFILDSLAMLMPEKYSEEDELAGSMGGTSIAKLNTQLVKRIIPLLKMANIILFVINHILPDPSTMPKKAQVSWLKIGERVPAGETALYLANHFLRFDDSSKLKKDEEFGITGIMVDVQLIKNRSNMPGVKVPLVLNYELGFDRELSLFVLLAQYKRINGAGQGLYLGDRNDLKFSKKNFKEKLANPEFAELFMKECMEVLDMYIAHTLQKEKEETPVISLTDRMIGMAYGKIA